MVAAERDSKPKGQPQATISVAYSSLPPSEIYRLLGTGVGGLSTEEAVKRLHVYGPNELPTERPTWFGILLNQFRNPMFLILLVVALASGVLGQPEQAAIIIVIMGFSVVLGFYNEFRAERLVEELQGSVSIKAVVMRDGKTTEVDSASIVPGDILQVYIGDIVAADTRIIDSKELEVNEAVLSRRVLRRRKEQGKSRRGKTAVDAQRSRQHALHGHGRGAWNRSRNYSVDGQEHSFRLDFKEPLAPTPRRSSRGARSGMGTFSFSSRSSSRSESSASMPWSGTLCSTRCSSLLPLR